LPFFLIDAVNYLKLGIFQLLKESAVFDAIVLGAGAAGLFCAGVAGQLGKKVLLLDHAKIIGEKIRISGGGRCNFTNRQTGPQHFLSMNPHFVKSAISRFSSADFIKLVERYDIAFHEKHRGQLFCDVSAKQIIELLLSECEIGNVEIKYPVSVQEVIASQDVWEVCTQEQKFIAKNLIIATGGLPVPAIGATDFALTLAKQLNIPVVTPRAALVPLSFTSGIFSTMDDFAGISIPVSISAGKNRVHYGHGHFQEDLLITHKGLSGPAVLQASSFWQEGEPVNISWIDESLWDQVANAEDSRKKSTEALLAQLIPMRLAKEFSEQLDLLGKNWAEVSQKKRQQLIDLLIHWSVKPAGTLGWNKAEVMVGGVDTKALDSKTMMAKNYPGLFFIGECVDVTGHLGGHNFQWAWSSGYVCAHALI
jgi:predicted Rossmann fold flavoprotein